MNENNNREYEREIRAYRRMITSLLNKEKRGSKSKDNTNNIELEKQTRKITEITDKMSKLAFDNVTLSEEMLKAIQDGDVNSEKRLKKELDYNKKSIKLYEDILNQTKKTVSSLEDLSDSLDETNSSLKDTFESIRDTITAFNIGNLGSRLNDEALDTKDIVREISNNFNKDWKDLRKDIRKGYVDNAKQFNNIFNSTEFTESLLEISKDIKDIDLAQEFAGMATAFEKVTGVAIKDYSKLYTQGTKNTIKALTDGTQNLRTMSNVSTDDLDTMISTLNDLAPALHGIYKGDEKGIIVGNRDLTNLLGAASSLDLDISEGVAGLISNKDISYGDYRDIFGMKGSSIQKSIKSGDLSNISNLYEDMFDSINSNTSFSNVKALYGDLIDEELFGKIKEGSITKQDLNKALDEASSLQSTGSLSETSKLIEDNMPFLGKLYNWFTSTAPGGAWETFMQNDIVEAVGGGLGGVITSAIGSSLFHKGIKGTLSSFTSLGSVGVAGPQNGLLAKGLAQVTNLGSSIMPAISKLAPWLSIGNSMIQGGKGLWSAFTGDTSGERTRGATKAGLNLGGAGLGAALGTFVFPGVGTVLGAALGSGAGAIADWLGGDWVADKIEDLKGGFSDFFKNTFDFFGDAKDSVSTWWKKLFNKDDDGIATSEANRSGLPKYQGGITRVPTNGMQAVLHKDEAVLTRAEADIWRSDRLAQNSLSLKDILSSSSLLEQMNQTRADFMSKLNSGSTTQTSDYTGDVSTTGDYEMDTWKILRSMGYSKAAVAGIMGNMYQESRVNPTLIQGNGRGPAAGIVQWENYNSKSKRWKKMADYANSKGKPWTDLQSQLEYLNMEMKGKDPTTKSILDKRFGGLDTFKSMTDPVRAMQAFHDSFERSSKPMFEVREKAANEYYNKFNAYEQGTPFVPSDQLALLHKGEMVVPANYNPNNKGKTIDTENGVIKEIREFMKLYKDSISYIMSKIPKDDGSYYARKSSLKDISRNNRLRGED